MLIESPTIFSSTMFSSGCDLTFSVFSCGQPNNQSEWLPQVIARLLQGRGAREAVLVAEVLGSLRRGILDYLLQQLGWILQDGSTLWGHDDLAQVLLRRCAKPPASQPAAASSADRHPGKHPSCLFPLPFHSRPWSPDAKTIPMSLSMAFVPHLLRTSFAPRCRISTCSSPECMQCQSVEDFFRVSFLQPWFHANAAS